MLTLKYITENTEDVIARLAKKHFDGKEIIAQVIELDNARKAAQSQVDAAAAEMNTLSKEIGMMFKQGKQEEANAAKEKTVQLKETIKTLGDEQAAAEKQLTDLLVQIPNLPHESVPVGKHAEDNLIERQGGEVPALPADAVPHWDLAKKYDLIDFELGVKISGAGFPVYKGKGARLQRALINFFLDNARDAGYLEVQPPYVVNAASGYGTGQCHKYKE
jgi:seryl-tRNA synthetase